MSRPLSGVLLFTVLVATAACNGSAVPDGFQQEPADPDLDRELADDPTPSSSATPSPTPTPVAVSNVFHVPGEFLRIQTAIDAALPGDTILVAPGTYDETLDIRAKDILLMSEAGSGSTFINARRRGTVLTVLGTTQGLRVEGFTLMNGLGLQGGGMRIDAALGTFDDIVIRGNSADDGGGLFIRKSVAFMTNLEISGNESIRFGGGMYVEQAAPVIDGIFIENNTAGSSGGGAYFVQAAPVLRSGMIESNSASMDGGGYASLDSSPVFQDIHIVHNDALRGGGGHSSLESIVSGPAFTDVIFEDNIAGEVGGGLAVDGAMAVFDGVRFFDNIADSGGGLYVNDSPYTFAVSLWAEDNRAWDAGGAFFFSGGTRLTLFNSAVLGNYASGYGGGIFLSKTTLRGSNLILAGNEGFAGGGLYGFAGGPVIANATVVDNRATGGFGGGFHFNEVLECHLVNTIAAFNVGGIGRENIYAAGSACDLEHNNLYLAGESGVEGLELGTQVVVDDPLFVDFTNDRNWRNDDLHLAANSPLVDAGIEGSRIDDPDLSVSDIGAYGGLFPHLFDLDQDGHYNWWDPREGPEDGVSDCNDGDASVYPGNGCQAPTP